MSDRAADDEIPDSLGSDPTLDETADVSDDPRVFAWRPATNSVRQVGGIHGEDELESIAGFLDPTHAVVVGHTGRVSTFDTATGTLRPLLRARMIAEVAGGRGGWRRSRCCPGRLR